MGSKVFLLERPRTVDYKSAKAHGEVHFVFEEDDRRASVFNTERYVEDVFEQLEYLGFDPESDSICVAGSVVGLVTAVAAIAMRYGFVNLLLFNATESAYVRRTVRCQNRCNQS